VYKHFLRKPEGKRSLGRTSEKLHTNISLVCVLKYVQTFRTKPEGNRTLGRTSEKLHTNIGLICVVKCEQIFRTKT